ncbi:hypothetical protein [Nocardia sp. XZ_19_385]|uniref:hypothetical protein n=1 Tax=Nocardia sp. XZ_19_385 TaxID=2769488 RepID=UPI00188ED36E|nr:hypothetical protein [Nocardia sp. XZ_19_385]
MTTQLLVRAETTKLARLLDVSDPVQLEFLSGLSPAAIRAFRERATDLLFDRDAQRLQRVAAASKLVPTAISAKAAERAFGPVLCAAVAGSVEPAQAVSIAKALPAKFLAETAVQLDPRRTAAVIAEVPPRLVAQVAKELFARGDHVTMGRFVGVVPEASMRAALPEASDADLLRIGFLLEDKSSMDTLLGIVEDRIPGVIRAACEQDLWAEAIDLLDTVDQANRAKIGDIAAGLGDDVLDALIEAVRELDAWATLLPVTSAMSQDSLRVLAARPVVHTEAVLGPIMDVALDHGLWLDLLPLSVHLPEAPLAFLAARVAEKPDDELADLIRQADTAGLWAALIPIALAMGEADRRRMAGLPVMREPEVLRAVIDTIAEHELWSQGLPLVDALPKSAKPILASCIGDLTREQLLAALLAAARSADIDTLVDIALAQESEGRARVLEIIDGMDDLGEFLEALTPETPEVVWRGLVEVRDEMPADLRAQLAHRAAACGKDSIADELQA